MAKSLAVVNTTLGEMVQVRWDTTFIVHPPTPLPKMGCVASNLYATHHPLEIRQACLRRSLPYLVPTRLRLYKVKVREQVGLDHESGAKFITVEFVNDCGRAVLLDLNEQAVVRTIIADVWVHPRFIIFEASALGAHPIRHLPHDPRVYFKWMDWIRRVGIAERLHVLDKQIIYFPDLDEPTAALVEVEELVWQSLRDFFDRYTHTGRPLDLDYHPEPQQVIAYYFEGKSMTDARGPSLTEVHGGSPTLFLQEYFRWHYFLDVHVSVDGSVRMNSGQLVANHYTIPTWPDNKLLLSADPLWVILLLSELDVPVEHVNGLYLTEQSTDVQRSIDSLRGVINEQVNLRHRRGELALVLNNDGNEAGKVAGPVKVLTRFDGQRLGHSNTEVVVIRTVFPAVVSRVAQAFG